MQVLSSKTGRTWLDSQADAEGNRASEEAKRVLSDCFRCKNLVLLTGLGTSLHVNIDTEASRMLEARSSIGGKKIAPTMRDLWDAAKERSGDNFSQVLSLSKITQEKSDSKNIEALLSYCKVAAEYVEGEEQSLIRTFVKDAEECIRDLVDFLAADDKLDHHTQLLRKIVNRSNRKNRAKIFTTNYDLCFEYAARYGKYVVIDGFSHTLPQVFDSIYYNYDIINRSVSVEGNDFISNVFHLYKLHGSIDWTRNEISRDIERNHGTKKPILIYPRNTKYELAFEQPYLDMMAAFQNAIRQPETGLLIVGFGFNDNHISEPILSAIRSNLNLKVVIVDPFLAPREQPEKAIWPGNAVNNNYLNQISLLAKSGDARLSLINETFEGLVPILPDIAAETELEQHYERLRKVRELAHGN